MPCCPCPRCRRGQIRYGRSGRPRTGWTRRPRRRTSGTIPGAWPPCRGRRNRLYRWTRNRRGTGSRPSGNPDLRRVRWNPADSTPARCCPPGRGGPHPSGARTRIPRPMRTSSRSIPPRLRSRARCRRRTLWPGPRRCSRWRCQRPVRIGPWSRRMSPRGRHRTIGCSRCRSL